MSSVESFLNARDLLFKLRADHDSACQRFRWPQLREFNWAVDYFDSISGTIRADAAALRVIATDGSETTQTFSDLSARSNQVANWLHQEGVQRGDPMLLMLGNVTSLWEVMLAAIKVGAVVIPATTLLGPDDLVDRIARGGVRHVVTEPGCTDKFTGVAGDYTKIALGEVPGWFSLLEASDASTSFTPDGSTDAADPLLRYFTSGTTARPKLVEHTHATYPVGHLSTMYWLGLEPGDVHLNISSPGWAKHAWSSFFAPWNAEATILVFNYDRFEARALLDLLVRCQVTTFCAPPTVWRMLIQEDLSSWPVVLREATSAGEPLNPIVIDAVRSVWGVTIRDGYGQTETTALVGNSPCLAVKPGAMGRPLPGYEVTLLDPDGNPTNEGEICLDLTTRPLGLMAGYRDDDARTTGVTRDGYYRTGDIASRDTDCYLTYVGRADDVFKASDYRISPFELESVLIEHEAVAEAAVIPSPDPVRLAVPKAFISLADGYDQNSDAAETILRFSRERLAPFKRVRRVEFGELPKTISGKIRRAELRVQEQARLKGNTRRRHEYWEEDFPGLR